MTKPFSRLSIWPILAALLAVTGCGYHFTGRSALPQGIGAVRVTMFQNRTAETAVERVFSEDLIREFQRNGIRVSPEAPAVVSGSIRSMTVDTVSRTGLITSVERRVRAVLNVRLHDGGKLVWSADELSDEETYTVSSDKSITEVNKRRAIEIISRRMAESIHDRMTSAF